MFVGFFGWLLGCWRDMLAAFLGIALYTILAGASVGVMRTDQNGWIELSTDGEWIWVEVERK